MNSHPLGFGLAATPRLVRNRRLGSTGVYRVLRPRGGVVEVEVVTAPGLRPGSRFGLTPGAVAGMCRRSATRRPATPNIGARAADALIAVLAHTPWPARARPGALGPRSRR